MNLDVSIHRMAVREAETLSVAQALIARKRQELDLRLQREQVSKRDGTAGANLDNALREMDERSKLLALDPETGAIVDKTA